MIENHNHLGQPVGFPLDGWQKRPRPPRTAMKGSYCSVEPINPPRHAAELYAAYAQDVEGGIWTYLPYGPFGHFDDFQEWMLATAPPLSPPTLGGKRGGGDDPLFHAIIEHKTGKAVGVASYLRIEPGIGVIEVGHINFAPPLQKTAAATEAMYLMMRRAFDELGYRRYEWKCDALNAGSCRAAQRLGFLPEGIFRQATMYKGRNRDTAWFSIIDSEWPQLKQAFEAWLDPNNFDEQGQQRKGLADLRHGAAWGSF